MKKNNMKKSNKKKKPPTNYKYKSNLISSIFLLTIYLIQLIILLIHLSEIPDGVGFSSIIAGEVLFLVGIIYQFYYTFGLDKSYDDKLALDKNRIYLRTHLIFEIDTLVKRIEEIEKKLINLDNLYFLYEKDEFSKGIYKNLKNMPQTNNFRLKMNDLSSMLKKLKNNHDIIRKYELKSLKSNKLKNFNKLKRNIKNAVNDINKLNTEYLKIELELKNYIKKRKDFIIH
ncbi:MAG: hypothetical protein ACFFAB_09925 [Candidatus Heimdallarchaeota archaeon]